MLYPLSYGRRQLQWLVYRGFLVAARLPERTLGGRGAQKQFYIVRVAAAFELFLAA